MYSERQGSGDNIPAQKHASVAEPGNLSGGGLQKAFAPSDPLFTYQWQNTGTAAVNLNLTQAWDHYSGEGVRIGVYDDGIDHDHPDLAANYDPSLHVSINGEFRDPTIMGANDRHGTAVAGLIAAVQGNGQGGVGGSFNASITGVDIFAGGLDNYFFGVLNAQDRFDITNHSWGFTGVFSDAQFTRLFEGIVDAAANGRGGLGTIQMVAAGNDRGSGDASDNTNTSNFTSSRHVNAISGIMWNGEAASFSAPGASLLVSAPAVDVVTTDVAGTPGYSTGDYTYFGGTSAATPVATGVVGLMLEANPGLGYRDVMEILAITARQVGNPVASGAGAALRPWQINGAENWNNGGMHFSHDYGFGVIDAFAAVKLAESWNLQQTLSNELVATGTNMVGGIVPDNSPQGLSRTINLTPATGTPITIEAIEVQINWSVAHSWSGDLVIELISPTGTTSYLLDRAGNSADLGNWTFMTRAHLGELATGVWTVRITDCFSGDTGTVSSISIRAYGSQDVSDTYYYTDEFAALAQSGGRNELTDLDGGTDTINAAAVSGGATINLNSGATNQIAGAAFVIAAGTVIENVIGTWSADTITGNDAANVILGNAGNDVIRGGGGSDTIDGGAGRDILHLDAAWNAVTWVVNEISVVFNYFETSLGSDIVRNVEQFIDSLGNSLTWAQLISTVPPTDPPPPSSEGTPTPPDAPVITALLSNSGSTGDTITNDATPTLSIQADADADHVEVFINGQSAGLAQSLGNGDYAFTPGNTLVDGTYTITAKAGRGDLVSDASAAMSVTVDTVAAGLTSLTPADNAISVPADANIVITFNESIARGSGQIEIRLASNDALLAAISVTSPEVTVSGNQLIINPPASLPAGAEVYVAMGNGVVTDVAGNAFGGISGHTGYNFTTAYGNALTGNDASNSIGGTAGADMIRGLGGDDSILGSGGDDIIDGGAGNDTLRGGTHGSAGDTVSYQSASAGVTVSLASTRWQNTGGAGTDRLYEFENLVGSAFNDRLTGNAGANTISGGRGDDVITGSLGRDIMSGDAGRDTFRFETIADTGNSIAAADIIRDFQKGQDVIDLSTIDASSVLRGNNSFVFAGMGSSFGSSSSGEIKYAHVNGQTVIYGDTDRDSPPEFQIVLDGIHTLTASDFIL